MSLFGGFFLNIDSLPSCISWLQYLSLFKYAFAAIMQNEFRGLKFTCDDQDSRCALKWGFMVPDSQHAPRKSSIFLFSIQMVSAPQQCKPSAQSLK